MIDVNAGAALTIIVLVFVMLPLDAVIVAVPADSAVTSPLLVTFATELLLEI